VQWCRLCCSFGLYLPVCWSDGYFLWCYVSLRVSFLLVCILPFPSRGVVCLGCWWSFCVSRCYYNVNCIPKTTDPHIPHFNTCMTFCYVTFKLQGVITKLPNHKLETLSMTMHSLFLHFRPTSAINVRAKT
jgi:hypothetical protein